MLFLRRNGRKERSAQVHNASSRWFYMANFVKFSNWTLLCLMGLAPTLSCKSSIEAKLAAPASQGGNVSPPAPSTHDESGIQNKGDADQTVLSQLPDFIGDQQTFSLHSTLIAGGPYYVFLGSPDTTCSVEPGQLSAPATAEALQQVVSEKADGTYLFCLFRPSDSAASGLTNEVSANLRPKLVAQRTLIIDRTPPQMVLVQEVSEGQRYPVIEVKDAGPASLLGAVLPTDATLRPLTSTTTLWEIVLKASGDQYAVLIAKDSAGNSAEKEFRFNWVDPVALRAPQLLLKSSRDSESGIGIDPTISILAAVPGEKIQLYEGPGCTQSFQLIEVNSDPMDIELAGFGQGTKSIWAKRIRGDFPFASHCSAVPFIFDGTKTNVAELLKFRLQMRQYDTNGREKIETYSSNPDMYSAGDAILISSSQGVVWENPNNPSERKNISNRNIYPGQIYRTFVSPAGTVFLSTQAPTGTHSVAVSYNDGRSFWLRSGQNGLDPNRYSFFSLSGNRIVASNITSGKLFVTTDEGHTFSHFPMPFDEESIPPVTTSVVETSDGTILVGTTAGLFRYAVATGGFQKVTSAMGLPTESSSIGSIEVKNNLVGVVSHDGWVVVSTNHGLTFDRLYDNVTPNMFVEKIVPISASRHILYEYDDDEGVNNVLLMDGTTTTSIHDRLNAPDHSYYLLYHSPQAIVVLSSNGISVSFDDAETFTYHSAASLGLSGFYAVKRIAGADVVIAQSGAKIISAGPTFTPMAMPAGNSFSFYVLDNGASVTRTTSATYLRRSMETDWNELLRPTFSPETSISAGTFKFGKFYGATNGGLVIGDASLNSPLTVRKTTEGLGSNSIKEVFIRANGSEIYAATSGGISFSTDSGATFANRTTANGLWSNNIFGIAVSSTGVIMAPHSGGGIGRSTNGGSSFHLRYQTHGLAGPWATGIVIDFATDRVYATSRPGTPYAGGMSISTDHGNTWIAKRVTDGLVSDYCQKIDLDDDGKIYVSTTGGFSISADQGMTFTNVTMANGLPSNDVRGVVKSNGVLYVATPTALAISNDQGASFTAYGANDGLPSSTIYSVLKDESGNVYVSSSKGLYRFYP